MNRSQYPYPIGLMTMVCLVGAASCGSVEEMVSTDEAVHLDRDLRSYASEARANLAWLDPDQRRMVEPMLAIHEATVRTFDRLAAQGQTRHAVQTPLLLAGSYMVANDATGVGVVDDVALPFLALGILATHILTNAPSSHDAMGRARDRVMESANDVTRVFQSMGGEDDGTRRQGEPGTREYCIDLYVECHQFSPRSFDRRNCQPCMDLCMGQGFEWPVEEWCRYTGEPSKPPRRRKRIPKAKVKLQ